jgi:formylglycine-generating enzyme required for sulfatase activity
MEVARTARYWYRLIGFPSTKGICPTKRNSSLIGIGCQLGYGTESPQHNVVIAQPFAVARDAGTRGQFDAFVSARGHKTEGGAFIHKGNKWEYDPMASWRVPGFVQDDSHPVVCINWDDAKA